jgi:nitroreductase/NAD-dependent dihydropyrimidine dehydrogenase PreA subunit
MYNATGHKIIHEEEGMSLFTIDEKKCKRDGICVAECPLKIIEMKDSKSLPAPTTDAAQRCIKCGHCVAVCPHGALTHTMMKAGDFPAMRKDWALSPERAEHFLRSRRSIRTYEVKPIEREKLQKLIEIARYAPTGSNGQLVSWLAINSRAEVAKLTGMVVDLMREMVKAKNPFAISYGLKRFVTAWENGIDLISRDAPALLVAHGPKEYGLAQVDCTSALAYLDLAAPSLGLGSCWAGFFMLAYLQWPPLQKALAIPDGHAAQGIMMVGYPKYRYHRLVPRNQPIIEWRM